MCQHHLQGFIHAKWLFKSFKIHYTYDTFYHLLCVNCILYPVYFILQVKHAKPS
jgi:RsiW-degrading membrane proteinase PrsW (M82 family)